MEKPLFAADRPESSGERLSMLADIHELHYRQFARGIASCCWDTEPWGRIISGR
jgi:hypothetical protein